MIYSELQGWNDCRERRVSLLCIFHKQQFPSCHPACGQAQAKFKAKSYDFRSDAVRGIQVTYPNPEPVTTPRAREGLRAVVPTIFPPSTVNRGESVRIRPSDLCVREAPVQQSGPDGLLHLPKKRGPKPKPRFKDGGCIPPFSETHKRRLEEQAGGVPPHKLAKLQQGAEDGRLLKAAHAHSHKHHHHRHYHHHHRHHFHMHNRAISAGSSYKSFYAERGLHLHRTYVDTHRTKDANHPGYLPLPQKHQSNPGQSLGRPAAPPRVEKPYFLDRPSPTRLDVDLDDVTWRPSLCNVEKVLVTDVTTNFLTVTIKESSTSKGFFKEKR